MPSSDVLRSLLSTQLNATVARRSPDEILQEVPPAARGVQPEGLPEAYSLWQILEHVRICQADYFQFCTDAEYTPPTWPDDYWPDAVAPPSDDAWTQSLNQFQHDRQSILEFVNDPSIDLTAEIPHAAELKEGNAFVDDIHGLTCAEQFATIADHNAYHLGQFVTVRRLLGVWPPEHMEAPDWGVS